MTETSLLARPLRPVGSFFGTCIDTVKALGKRPFHAREFLDQTVFIIRVTMLPALFLVVPYLGVVLYLVNQLLAEIGALDLAGSAAGLVVLTNAAPVAAVLVVSGAGATAVAADLGSRVIRDEIAALEVLGIDPVHRLVLPRVLALTVVSTCLTMMLSIIGIVAGYVISVVLQGAAPGQFLASITLLAGVGEFWSGLIKGAMFGLLGGLIACHRGLRTAGGPKAVGDAVNETVVFSFIVLFLVNALISAVRLQFGLGNL